MVESEAFLSILSKLMNEMDVKPSESVSKVEALYVLINGELTNELDSSAYPNSPALLRNMRRMVNSMENYAYCPELIGKQIVYIQTDQEQELLSKLSFLFEKKIPAKIQKHNIDLPVVLVDDNAFSLEVITYANKRVKLTATDFDTLFSHSKKTGFALYQIIKYIFIHIPMRRKNTCFALDSRFYRFWDLFRDFLDEDQEIIIDKSHERGEDGTKQPDISSIIQKEKPADYYPIKERFERDFSELEAFYIKKIQENDELLKLIRADITRSGISDGEDELHSLREEAKSLKSQFEQELKSQRACFISLIKLVDEFNELIENKCNPSNITPKHMELLYETMFTYADAGSHEKVNTYATLIKKAEDEQINWLVDEYVHAINNNKKSNNLLFLDSLHETTWYHAKLMISGSSDQIIIKDGELVNELMKRLTRKHITTGKEWFFLSYFEERLEDRIYDLERSAEKGYNKAFKKLMKLYHNREYNNIPFLATLMWPEACRIYGIQQKKGKKATTNFYIKLAAVYEDAEAMYIVAKDIFISTLSKLPKRSEETDKDAGIVIYLCDKLIKKEHEPAKCAEMKGIAWFCLENYSAAMRELSGCNTDLANYCKGRMHEEGLGTAIDLNEAIEHYQNSNRFKDSLRRMNKINKKLEEEKETTYNSSKHSSSSSSHSSSSGCFITTATVIALEKGESCNELNTLREFRDKYVKDNAKGQGLVIEYYRVAPLIIKKIDKQKDADTVYTELWENHIKPSCEMIRKKEFKKARDLYIRMVYNLSCRYKVKLKPHIYEMIRTEAWD